MYRSRARPSFQRMPSNSFQGCVRGPSPYNAALRTRHPGNTASEGKRPVLRVADVLDGGLIEGHRGACGEAAVFVDVQADEGLHGGQDRHDLRLHIHKLQERRRKGHVVHGGGRADVLRQVQGRRGGGAGAVEGVDGLEDVARDLGLRLRGIQFAEPCGAGDGVRSLIRRNGLSLKIPANAPTRHELPLQLLVLVLYGHHSPFCCIAIGCGIHFGFEASSLQNPVGRGSLTQTSVRGAGMFDGS